MHAKEPLMVMTCVLVAMTLVHFTHTHRDLDAISETTTALHNIAKLCQTVYFVP